MVKKLLKQEKIYYMRSLLPVYIILFSLSVMGSILHLFESKSWIYSIVGNTSVVVYSISAFATLLLTTVFIVIRFYKNMFTGEGYLTLTLPVTFEQHLFAKLFAALAAALSTLIVTIISFMIFLGKDWLVEIYKAFVYLVGEYIAKLGVNFGIYIVEFLLLLVLGTAVEILMYYTCISLGQMCRKRKILAAVGIYYGIYLVTQVIVTVITIVITLAWENIDLVALERWISTHYQGLIHGGLLCGIACSTIMCVVLFFLCRTILKKRLNLE